jgi:Uncharacterized protein conserved in bacteria
MSPYEIYYRGGSVEHYNDEAGIVWLNRLKDHFKSIAWINPMPEYSWEYYESTSMIRTFTEDKMFPFTLDGLTQTMKCLKNNKLVYSNRVWGE